MDPASLGGMGFALAMVLLAIVIEGSSPMSVVMAAPMVLVFGGTLGAGLASATLRDAMRAFGSLKHWLAFRTPDPDTTVQTIAALAATARRAGRLSLALAARGVKDAFLRTGLQAAIAGTDPDDLRAMLEDRIASRRDLDRASAKYFST